MNIKNALKEIDKLIKPYIGQGKVADYIPLLEDVSLDQFAMSVITPDGKEFSIGSFNESFSIQSISKVFNLTMALDAFDSELWKRVRQEPSGKAFNSLEQLETENGIPRNPFINSGAIVICDILCSTFDDPVKEALAFIRKISGNPNIKINHEVYRSEKEYGARNYSSAYLTQSYGNIKNNIDKVISTYFSLCSIEISTIDLARAGLFLANKGKSLSGESVVTSRQAKRINSIMLTCGTYDNVGEFAYRVGLPAKSGVGGGILATLPGEFSIAVWSPGLNKKGNSVAGYKALEEFTTLTDLSIF